MANFYVHFADGVFDISIFGGWRWVQIAPGKKICSNFWSQWSHWAK